MTYTDTAHQHTRLSAALFIASAVFNGGGMLLIARALADAQTGGPIPLIALPFGIVMFGVGNVLSLAGGRYLFARTLIRRYEGTHTP